MKKTARTIKLSRADTREYENKGSRGDAFRKMVRAEARYMSVAENRATVEIHSYDGIVFDAIRAE